MGILNEEEIKRYIPHRQPFLFLDTILELNETRIVAQKHFSEDEYFLRGYYPEDPQVPLVLLVEAIAQASGIIASRFYRQNGKRLIVTGMEKIRFHKKVVSGDTVVFEVKPVHIRGRVAKVRGIASVNGKTVVEAEITGAFVS
jgi:3-hydroxyacyl-[acyl-carrier-protein] dehydratase